ncbi:MAG TPA: GspH/FimT family pseudopilin [Longimicrobium sp.]|nr:GspH/FimT family pseudopilin [Longimicrobium sp.]
MPTNFRTILRSRQGFSLVETLAVLTIIGILFAIAAPRFSGLIGANRVVRARDVLASDLNLARMQAIRRGGPTSVQIVGGNQYFVVVPRPNTTAQDTIKRVKLGRDYPGVTLSPAAATIAFDSRGLLRSATTTNDVAAVQGTRSIALKITQLGGVYRVK